MNPKIIQKRQNPEAIIQDSVTKLLESRKWLVKSTHGNIFSHGFPDLYCAHTRFGTRWIEIKNPTHFVFTASQLEFFPKLNAAGVGVWILVRATEDEYQKLFKPPNWYTYLL